jgi:hypothetical protein
VLVHQTVRLTPKAFRQRRPDPATPGAWIWNLEGGGARPLSPPTGARGCAAW